MALVVEIVAYLKNMEKGAFSLFHLADLSPWQPKKFSIFGNEQKKKKNEQKKNYFLFYSFFGPLPDYCYNNYDYWYYYYYWCYYFPVFAE